MIDLNDARLFVQVVEQGGFSRAARVLERPKSSISNRIAKLEDYLGARLIHRTSRQFALTDIGREFFDHASAMLTEAMSAEEAVRSKTAEPRGTVRVTSSVATAQAGLALVLAGFIKAFPKVRVHLSVTNRSVDLVDEGYDLAVRAHEQPLPDSEMIQRRLGFSYRWLVASPSYLARRGTPEEPPDIAGHDALCMSASFESDWMLTTDPDVRVLVKPRPAFCADDPVSLQIAACDGLGIAMLPAGLCRSHVHAGRLSRVLPEWTAGGAFISILTPHRRGQLPAVRTVSDHIADHLRDAMNLET
jgi:DNA-binding transcriptional LysR family regulator